MSAPDLKTCQRLARAWYKKNNYAYRAMWGKVHSYVFYIDVCKRPASKTWETKNIVLSTAALTEYKAWLSALEGIAAWNGLDTVDELLVVLDLEGI